MFVLISIITIHYIQLITQVKFHKKKHEFDYQVIDFWNFNLTFASPTIPPTSAQQPKQPLSCHHHAATNPILPPPKPNF